MAREKEYRVKIKPRGGMFDYEALRQHKWLRFWITDHAASADSPDEAERRLRDKIYTEEHKASVGKQIRPW